MAIARYGDDIDAVLAQQAQRFGVGRLFDDHRIARRQQALHHQTDGVLRAVGDQHLFRLRGDALRAEDAAQRIAQRVVAAVFPVAEGLFRMAAEHRQQHFAKRLQRKHLRAADAGGEVDQPLRQRGVGVAVQP